MAKRAAICLYCQKAIKSGRSDKKFCDSFCKDAYNNSIKENERSEISRIDIVLKKIRRVLKKLYEPKNWTKKFTREAMIRQGFEFGFQTHVAITASKGNEIIFCYDYGYREVDPGKYQIYPTFSEIQVKGGYEVKVK